VRDWWERREAVIVEKCRLSRKVRNGRHLGDHPDVSGLDYLRIETEVAYIL
jgi:hypothetical protein